MSAESCSTCRYGRPSITDDTDEPFLRCHRYPPTIFVLDGDVSQAWSDMGEGDWCGEYQRG